MLSGCGGVHAWGGGRLELFVLHLVLLRCPRRARPLARPKRDRAVEVRLWNLSRILSDVRGVVLFPSVQEKKSRECSFDNDRNDLHFFGNSGSYASAFARSAVVM